MKIKKKFMKNDKNKPHAAPHSHYGWTSNFRHLSGSGGQDISYFSVYLNIFKIENCFQKVWQVWKRKCGFTVFYFSVELNIFKIKKKLCSKSMMAMEKKMHTSQSSPGTWRAPSSQREGGNVRRGAGYTEDGQPRGRRRTPGTPKGLRRAGQVLVSEEDQQNQFHLKNQAATGSVSIFISPTERTSFRGSWLCSPSEWEHRIEDKGKNTEKDKGKT